MIERGLDTASNHEHPRTHDTLEHMTGRFVATAFVAALLVLAACTSPEHQSPTYAATSPSAVTPARDPSAASSPSPTTGPTATPSAGPSATLSSPGSATGPGSANAAARYLTVARSVFPAQGDPALIQTAHSICRMLTSDPSVNDAVGTMTGQTGSQATADQLVRAAISGYCPQIAAR